MVIFTGILSAKEKSCNQITSHVTGEYTSSQIRILLSPAIYLQKHSRESRFAIFLKMVKSQWNIRLISVVWLTASEDLDDILYIEAETASYSR